MNKFKFGDKVWHEEYGLGVVHMQVGKTTLCLFENVPNSVAPTDKLTLVTDWVKCSECMPEFGQSVTVYDGDRMWTDTTYDFGDGLCFYYDDDGRATHWMPLPAPPMEIAND